MGCGATANKGLLKVKLIDVLPAGESKLVNVLPAGGDLHKGASVEKTLLSKRSSSFNSYDDDGMQSLFPKSRTSIKGVRTTLDSALNPNEALEELKKGNKRYLSGETYNGTVTNSARVSLASDGQSPMAAIIGCADSRVPVEIVFDAQPGDLFILRNAGNTCSCAEGSIVGSTEYCIGNLRTPLVLVMGHTKCGALAGATQVACGPGKGASDSNQTMLQSLLKSLGPPVREAVQMCPESASLDEIAAVAIKRNVFHTMRSLLKYSTLLSDEVNKGNVQIQGAIYDIMTGEVEFLGPLPN
jgi:carbonic anhydrase